MWVEENLQPNYLSIKWEITMVISSLDLIHSLGPIIQPIIMRHVIRYETLVKISNLGTRRWGYLFSKLCLWIRTSSFNYRSQCFYFPLRFEEYNIGKNPNHRIIPRSGVLFDVCSRAEINQSREKFFQKISSHN